MMKNYTGEKIFAFNKLQEFRALIPSAGVSVAVAFWNGTEWVVDDNSPVTTPKDVSCAGVRIRLTPTPIDGNYGFDTEGAL